MIASGPLIENMFKLDIKTNEFACSAIVTENRDFVLWHRRLAHTNFATLKTLLNIKVENDMKCVVCAEGKLSRKPFNETGTRAIKLLQVIHTDVCGPMTVRSFGNFRYFVTFIDDYSRKVFVYPMKTKGEVFSKFLEFKARVENETEAKIKVVRSDNGTEYDNNNFREFFIKHGIKYERSVPYSPQQNGLAERMNRTIIEKVRCMLIDAKLSKQFWGEAVCAAVNIINVLPNSSNNMVPNELWGQKPCNMKLFKVFGCKAMVWKPEQKRKKLDAKAYQCIFLRYADNAKAYRLFDLNTQKIVISRDVVFMENENKILDSSTSHSRNYIERVTIDGENECILTENVGSGENDTSEPTVNETQNTERVSTPVDGENNIRVSAEEQNEQSAETDIVEISDDSIDAETSNVLENTLNETLDQTANDPTFTTRAHIDTGADRPKTRGMTRAEELLNLHVAFVVGEPESYKQALKDENCEQWQAAMKEEYDSLIKNNTWELVERPPGEKIVDNKWVYKVKMEQKNAPARYKARLVARGFTQQYGVNYYETFSPVVRFTSIRLILSLAAQRKMHIKQFDVKTAFLNGILNETVYMEQPTGFEDGTNKVCKLKKSLYGLKQASRCWNEKFTSFIKLFGFKQCQSDSCVFISKRDGALTLLAIHVDDGLVVGEKLNDVLSVIKYLGEKFEIKEMNVGCFLGLEIQQSEDNSIFVHQTEYARKVLKRFNMLNCIEIATPADPNQVLNGFDESDPSNYPYRELIGSLMYLAIGTRPDIAHAVGVASRFVEKPTIVHERAAKRILKYLKRTINFGILYIHSTTKEIQAFSDADYAGCLDTRRSTSGYAFIFCHGAISWGSERQHSVSLSTAESEYMAAALCVKELVWIRKICIEIFDENSFNIKLFMDNDSAIRLTKNPEFHKRTKHIDVRYHFIREKYAENQFTLQHVPSDRMAADVLTKALAAQKFNGLIKMLGVTQI